MTYKHLDRHDRNQIEILLIRGYVQKDIAQVLKVHPSTVSREIKKYSCSDGTYRASVAQHKADIRRRNSKFCSMKIQNDTELKKNIITALEQHQSPQGISVRLGDISHVSIYKWLYSSWGQQYCRYLCSKRYRKKRRRTNKSKREMIQNAVSIHERPNRGVHLEGDLFVSPRKYGHSVSVAVLVDPVTQYIWAVKIPNRKPSTMVSYVNEILKDIQIDSITWDRGIENKYHEQFNTKSYFCDPRAPWQKPHVENNIGLLRKWFVPKQTDLRCMTQKQLDRYVCIVNEKWRVSRGGKSARELLMESDILKSKKLRFTV